MQKPAKVTVHFIVHGDYSHIGGALASLYAHTTVHLDAHLTLNTGASSEAEALVDAFPELHLHINPAPRGFAENHNAILRQAQTPYVALLNDDIEFQGSSLNTLIRYLDAHPEVGLVGPLIQNPDGSPQLSTFSDPSLLRQMWAVSGLAGLTRHGGLIRKLLQKVGIAQHLGVESLRTDLATREVPVVVGVAMVVRREAYEQAGLIDEYTRFYGEEYGWQWRLRQCGWRVVFVPDTRIVHYNPDQSQAGWKLTEYRKSILSYFLAYKPAWQATLIRVSIVISSLFAAVAILPFNRSRSKDYWSAVRMAITYHISRQPACAYRTSRL